MRSKPISTVHPRRAYQALFKAPLAFCSVFHANSTFLS